MAHSIESRVPFLDHRVVEFALGLPDHYKLGGGVTKRVLRAAMSAVLPERIRDRIDKLAFETPEFAWMSGDHRDWFRGRLSDAVQISDGLVAPSVLARFDAMAAGRRPFDREPWRAIAFGAWMRAFRAGAASRGQARPA